MANFGSIQSDITVTGTGAPVLATSPSLVTPALGVATATTINKVTITAPASGSTLTIQDGFTLTVSGTANVSGTNTGDQTSVSGNAGTATSLQNARTIGGVSFNGTANITVATATGGFTISGGDLALGANNITMTGSLGATGARLTKGWFTDLQVTNAITGSITGNAGTTTALQTGRTINGVTFDGTANILIPSILWTVTTVDATMAINNGYLANKGTLLTLTLPSSAAVGSVIKVAGMNAGLWKIAQNANGIIHFGNQNPRTILYVQFYLPNPVLSASHLLKAEQALLLQAMYCL